MTGSPAPKVSVVMGVYNEVHRLRKAVASILGQSLRDLELIVIDDGSSDGSGELLDKLAAEDSRLRVEHRNNLGLTSALIRGCELARGTYIARQDSDDWSHAERLREQVALLDSDARIGFVSCATQFVGPEDEPLTEMRRDGDPVNATRALMHERHGPPAHGSVMFRAETYRRVGGYRAVFLYSQDSDLWLRMGAASLVGYVPEVRYFHRKDLASTSGAQRQAQSRFAEIAHSCRRARDLGLDETPFLRQAGELSVFVRSETRRTGRDDSGKLAIAYMLGSQLAKNRDSRARRYLWQVIKSRPFHWRAWARMAQSIAQGLGAA